MIEWETFCYVLGVLFAGGYVGNLYLDGFFNAEFRKQRKLLRISELRLKEAESVRDEAALVKVVEYENAVPVNITLDTKLPEGLHCSFTRKTEDEER